MHGLQAGRIHIALVHQAPDLHHLGLGIVERQGWRRAEADQAGQGRHQQQRGQRHGHQPCCKRLRAAGLGGQNTHVRVGTIGRLSQPEPLRPHGERVTHRSGR